ncbi:tyrosine-type recombinase/integrase, partial [Xanthomonas phaseoli]|uniref:tyrosine-type recombinase/integrase n=1 Tax=Xanthomonas phaseoli TaxID=1985254 RepID=UPI0004CECDFE
EVVVDSLPNSTGLGYGRQLSRQFSVYIKRQGVSEKGQGFHGFRHTIASKLDEAGVSASAIGALTGHGTGQTVLEKFYIDRRSLPDRVATLARFSPQISLPVYESGLFT